MSLDTIEQNRLVGRTYKVFNAVDTDVAFKVMFKPIGSKTAIAAATVETDANGDIVLKEDASTVDTVDISALTTGDLSDVKADIEANEGWYCSIMALPTDLAYDGSATDLLASQAAQDCYKTLADIVFDTSGRTEFVAALTFVKDGAANITKLDDLGVINEISTLRVKATGTNPTVTVYGVGPDEVESTIRDAVSLSSGTESTEIQLNTTGPLIGKVSDRIVVKLSADTAITTPLINIEGYSYRANA